MRRTGPRHGGRCRPIHHCGGLFLGLGPIHRRPGCGIDHHIRRMGMDRLGTGHRVGKIGLITAQKPRCGIRLAQPDKLLRDLPRAPKDQKRHALTPNRSPTPARDCRARHHASFCKNHWTVRRNPSSSVTDGRQPSSVLMRLGSMA